MDRRRFLKECLLLLASATADSSATPGQHSRHGRFTAMSETTDEAASKPVTLCLCGDVMTGRGIDQILPHPSDPTLHEPYMKSAVGYVTLAEAANGPIPRRVAFSYLWGDALKELERIGPDARIINLETSITRSDAHWRDKYIHYRMHPDNIPCLTAVRIDCCALANNHVLDWGYPGLLETLDTLQAAGLRSAGAGRNAAEAKAPAVIEIGGEGRVLVFSFGTESSGIPPEWAAGQNGPGVNLLEDFSDRTVREIEERVRAVKRPGDIVVASIHWGGNWGHDLPRAHTLFARRLIDEAAVDVIHGHSSHHPQGIEVYRDRPILYGCGDFLNDYEGISGHEAYRSDLALMYFASLAPSTGKLVRLEMTPTQTKRFRLNRASAEDAKWLRDTLDRESRRFGVRVDLTQTDTLALRWGEGLSPPAI